jgi:hypothetical protein
MTDQFPPPGWFPRPAIWPYWPSSLRDTFTPPQPPNDPWNQINAQWRQPPVGANAAATTPQPNDGWDRTTPGWLRSAAPPLSSGGILGSFPQPNDAADQGTSTSSQSDPSPSAGRGILALLDRWNGPQNSGTGGGILAPLERLNNPGNQTTPAWLQPAAPLATNAGSFSRSTVQPWDYSPPQKLSAWENAPTSPSLYPFLPQPAAAYSPAPQPNDARTVVPPLEHLDSARYRAGPTPQGASEQLPSRGLYLSPVPQAPSWDSVPTYPLDGAGKIFPQPPSPTSWGASTLGVNAAGDSPPDEAAPARDARDARWESSALPSPTALPWATNFTPTSNLASPPNPTAIMSDADPEGWIPGGRYAQNSSRGGRRGPAGRELSVPEENRLFFYDSALRMLRELDPRNPQLKSFSTSSWVPTDEDINRLNEEIVRVKRERGLSWLEPHHTLPRQFSRRFNDLDIDIEDYIVHMPKYLHRLLPNGLHTGPNNWNARWEEFFEEHKNPTPDEIFEHLNYMLKQIPREKMP